MDNLIDFDVKQYEELKNFEPVPKNQYVLRITDCKLNLTKKGKEGTGEQNIRFDFVIDKGDFEGRNLIAFLNINNENEIARDYSRRNLRTITNIVDKVDEMSSKKDLNLFIGCLIGADVDIDFSAQKPTNRIKFYLSPDKVVDKKLSGFVQMAHDQANPKSLLQKGAEMELNDDIPF